MRVRLAIFGLLFGLIAEACAGAPPPPPPPAPPVVSVLGPGEDMAVVDLDGASPPQSDAMARPALADAAGAPAPVTVIAQNLHASAALAVDLHAVYWVDEAGGEVARAPKRGGLTMTLYPGNGGGFATGSSIAVEGGDVYWTADVEQGKGRLSTLMRLEKNGGKPTVLASSSSGRLQGLALDAQSVYWLTGGSVMRAPKAGGPTTAVISGMAGANAIALDDRNIYVSSAGTEAKQYADGSVAVVPKRGPPARTLVADSARAANVAVDDRNVYWQAASGVMKVAKSGGSATVLATPDAPIDDLALDDLYVYFAAHKTTSDGTIARVSKDGGAIEVLASGQKLPAGIAVDPTAVYWSCLGSEEKKYADGTVNKREKP